MVVHFLRTHLFDSIGLLFLPSFPWFFFFLIYLFTFGCIGSLLLWGLSWVVARGGCSSSRCTGFSLCWFSCFWTQALHVQASVVVAHGLSACGSWVLERSLSSYDAWTQVPHSIWNPPWPKTEPVSPALAGGFLNTRPPG